jgi:hypothetical protein
MTNQISSADNKDHSDKRNLSTYNLPEVLKPVANHLEDTAI